MLNCRASAEGEAMRRVMFVFVVGVLASGFAPGMAVASTSCGDPGDSWEQRAPSKLGMNAGRLQDALDWATTHNSASVAVYRQGCLAGQSRLDPVTSGLRLDGWSMTKSVTALLVGRAVTLGRFDIDRPIGHLYPAADRSHGALTPRHLLTMTAGLHRNWVRDLSPQPDRVRDALSLPFDHRPGSYWGYQQSTVTLLANAVERSVGTDLQDWAQRELFGPVGIPRDAWEWDRDRAGHTEGWAHLKMQGPAWARLGHLVLRRGSFGGRRLISRRYFRQMVRPGRVNNAYGFLTWLNRGGSYVLPEVEGPDRGEGQIVAAAPEDSIVWAGSGEQRMFAIPSRDIVIVRLGERGSREADTRVSLWTGRGGEVDNELVRRVMLAVTDVPYRDPGPYGGSDLVLPPHDSGVVGDAQETDHAVAGLGVGPRAPQGCNPTGCE